MTVAQRELAVRIKALALSLGFDLVGIAPAVASPNRDRLRAWLDRGWAGEMSYLLERFEERTDPARYLEGAASVICVAMNYCFPQGEAPPQQAPAKVARYARGDDYHELIKPRLYAIADWIRDQAPGTRTRCGVDTAPILEREHAQRAGIGWIGKNTCLIHPQVGSWLLLGQVITTLELPPDEPRTDHCGACRRCIDACPTQAIVAPWELDATRCISYLTIEHAGPIPPDLQEKMGDWLFGCDVCQEVCPFNAKAPTGGQPALRSRFPGGTLDAAEVSHWKEAEYRRTLKGSAMKRVKLPVLRRNAQIVLANAKLSKHTE